MVQSKKIFFQNRPSLFKNEPLNTIETKVLLDFLSYDIQYILYFLLLAQLLEILFY